MRDHASGLALPNVGVDVEFAFGLVDQAVVVTETMVRRRVAQKFINLRYSVMQECLVPFFTRDAMQHVSSSDSTRVAEIDQMASVALSNGLQLIDDTAKSILTGGVVVSDLKGVDYAMVKEAVQGCGCRFAMWLAASWKILAGCKSSNPNLTIEANENSNESGDVKLEGRRGTAELNITVYENDMSVRMQQDNINERVVDARLDSSLLDDLEMSLTPESCADLILAISEMCRLAQRSVMENINQSISTDNSGSRTEIPTPLPRVARHQ